MFIWESLFIWAKPRKTMQGYSRNREDFLELLYHKYKPMEEEVIWCLWDWHTDTDFQLCKWDSDLLPKLVKKDEIRFTYNQYLNKRSYVSCTIFAAVGMASDLTNYQFSYDEIKEIDDTSYNNSDYPFIRQRGQGWYVKCAVDHVRKRWNKNEKLVKKYWKLASYCISKYDDEIIEDTINNLYTIDWNLGLNSKYNEDKKDWMIDGTDFWTKTSWHSVDIVCKEWQRSVKDSGSVEKNNYYWLKNKLSQISNFGQYFYVYTLVKEDNYERIKKLNEMKTKILNWQEINSELWHLSNSEFHKNKLHDMNDFYREWIEYINNELKKLV